MSYKLKSLVYFFSFVASATLYYVFDKGLEPQTNDSMVELAEADMEQIATNEMAKLEVNK